MPLFRVFAPLSRQQIFGHCLDLAARFNNVINVAGCPQEQSLIQPNSVTTQALAFWEIQRLIILGWFPSATGTRRQILPLKKWIAVKRIRIRRLDRDTLGLQSAQENIAIQTIEC